uniref:Uncharacterized protein n=1 Tax=Chenopodium quinoa TaxID=63459 RepID=A0A803MYB0_CHEQI
MVDLVATITVFQGKDKEVAREETIWVRPARGSVKLNVDGAWNSKEIAGAGAVIRASEGGGLVAARGRLLLEIPRKPN